CARIGNHPEGAILGVSRMEWRPVWRGGEFVARLMLPLSLSYDHRVIDGADAARFTPRAPALTADPRRRPWGGDRARRGALHDGARVAPRSPAAAGALVAATSRLVVRVPDLGDFSDVEVVEVLVAPADRVEAEQSRRARE